MESIQNSEKNLYPLNYHTKLFNCQAKVYVVCIYKIWDHLNQSSTLSLIKQIFQITFILSVEE